MEKNISDMEGGLRIVIGIVLALVYTGSLGIAVVAPLSWVVLALAVIMLVTGIFGFCPIYKLLGINASGTPADAPAPKNAKGKK